MLLPAIFEYRGLPVTFPCMYFSIYSVFSTLDHTTTLPYKNTIADQGPEKQSSTDLTPDEQEALDIAAAIAASHAVSQPAVVSAEMAAAIAASRQSFTQGTSINSARQASGSRRGSGSAASGATQQDASSSRGPSPPGRAAAGASSASGGSSGNVSGGFNSQSSRTPPRSRSGTGGSASAAGGGPTFSGGGVGGLPAANMFSPSETVVATTNGTAVVEASASPANADSKSNGGGQEDRGHAESNSWNWQGLGRSFFGAMMKAAAGEGSPAADGETARKVTGKGGATHARELTPYTMQQTAGGKYGVVVMRKNKQVRCYASPGRAFGVSIGWSRMGWQADDMDRRHAKGYLALFHTWRMYDAGDQI